MEAISLDGWVAKLEGLVDKQEGWMAIGGFSEG
jgi:hypothetical protein